jgi:hypothetical protein
MKRAFSQREREFDARPLLAGIDIEPLADDAGRPAAVLLVDDPQGCGCAVEAPIRDSNLVREEHRIDCEIGFARLADPEDLARSSATVTEFEFNASR